MRLRLTVLALSAIAVLAACGTTTSDVTQSGLAGGPQGRGATGARVADADDASDLPGIGATNQEFTGTAPGASGTGGSTTTTGALRGGGMRAEKREPIQVGLMIWDNSQIQKALGISEEEGTGPALRRNAFRALIKAINAAGGVAGRQLVALDASVDVTSQNWNSDFEAACQKLTKDNHVSAVIDDGLFYHQAFNSCLAKAGVPQFKLSFTGDRIGDRTDLQNMPGLIGVSSVDVDRKVENILNKAVAAGFLRSGSKLGIIVEDCPYNLRAYQRTLAPIVARHRINVSRQDVTCAQHGFSQAGPMISTAQSAVLRFRSENVDSVMFLSQLEGDLYFYFSQQADSQQWAPQYLVFGTPGLCTDGVTNCSTAQLERMRGFGGHPLKNVMHPPAPSPAQAAVRKTCLSMLRSQGLTVSTARNATKDDLPIVFDICDGVFLLRAALTNTQGETSLPRIVAGIEQLGTGFASTLTHQGATRFGSGRHDGLELTAVTVFQAKCRCFTYIAPARPIS